MDSLNEALMQRYGVTRSDQIDSTPLASVSVGQEHYRSFAPVTGEYLKRLAEMCCDGENVDSSWCTRYMRCYKYCLISYFRDVRPIIGIVWLCDI